MRENDNIHNGVSFWGDMLPNLLGGERKMAYMTYITKHGEVKLLRHKDIGASWWDMNSVNPEMMRKEEKEFLERFGLEFTPFNVGNLREFGVIHLTSHWTKVVLKNGAIDKREMIE